MAIKKTSKSSTKKKSQKNTDSSSLLQWPSKPISANLPLGSLNTKIIINNGDIVERIYTTPNGQIISLFPATLNEEVA